MHAHSTHRRPHKAQHSRTCRNATRSAHSWLPGCASLSRLQGTNTGGVHQSSQQRQRSRMGRAGQDGCSMLPRTPSNCQQPARPPKQLRKEVAVLVQRHEHLQGVVGERGRGGRGRKGCSEWATCAHALPASMLPPLAAAPSTPPPRRASMLLNRMSEDRVANVASSSTRGSTASFRYPMLLARGRQAGR